MLSLVRLSIAAAIALAVAVPGTQAQAALRGLAYQGRRFDVAIGAQQTTVTLDSGDPVPVEATAQPRR